MAKYQNKPNLTDFLQRRKQNIQQLCNDWKTYTSIDFKQRLDKEGMTATVQEVGLVDIFFKESQKVVLPKELVNKVVHKPVEVVPQEERKEIPLTEDFLGDSPVVDPDRLNQWMDESKRGRKKKFASGSNS